jgi:rubrerythrin
MGTGLIMQCPNCEEEQLFDAGIGYFFPQVYKEIVQDIKNGVYGAEIRKVLEENDNAYVNAENLIYHCEACDFYDMHPCLDVYILESDREYAMPYDFEGREPIFKYPHICPECGAPLKQVSIDEFAKLAAHGKVKCPHCKTPMTSFQMVDWD